MARNRQRSKQRQAERRARRLQEERGRRGDGGGIPGVTPEPVEPVEPIDPVGGGGPGIDPDLVAGAPPEEVGESDYFLAQEQDELEAERHIDEDAPPASEQEALEEIEDCEVAEDFAEDDLVHDEAPSG